MLPLEIQYVIFDYLDYKSLCKVSSVCYYWYKISLDDKYWKNIFNNEYKIYCIEKYIHFENIKDLFRECCLNTAMKNRKRIINCINQVKSIYEKEKHLYQNIGD